MLHERLEHFELIRGLHAYFAFKIGVRVLHVRWQDDLNVLHAFMYPYYVSVAELLHVNFFVVVMAETGLIILDLNLLLVEDRVDARGVLAGLGRELFAGQFREFWMYEYLDGDIVQELEGSLDLFKAYRQSDLAIGAFGKRFERQESLMEGLFLGCGIFP